MRLPRNQYRERRQKGHTRHGARTPRRIYLAVLAVLAVILILLAGVYLQIDRPASPTSTTASGEAGVPVFQYSVSGPSAGAFRCEESP